MRFQQIAQYWSHWAFKLNALSEKSAILISMSIQIKCAFSQQSYSIKMTHLGPKLWPPNCPCDIDTFEAKIFAVKVSSQNDTFRAKALTTKLSLWNWHIWAKILAAKVSSQNDTFGAKTPDVKLSSQIWHVWSQDFGHQSIVKKLHIFNIWPQNIENFWPYLVRW